jgi:hypothetical protein
VLCPTESSAYGPPFIENRQHLTSAFYLQSDLLGDVVSNDIGRQDVTLQHGPAPALRLALNVVVEDVTGSPDTMLL